MIDYKKIAGMGEDRKKKKPAPKKVEIKKKKEEAPKAKTAPVTPITRKEIKDEPKSKPSFKPPKAKARPERKETSERRFRGFVAGPRETKKETMPKTTGPGNTSSIMKQTRRPKQYKKIKQGPYTSGNVLKNIVEQIPKKPRDQRAGGGKVGNKYFTGGMVNPSYGTDFDDR